ncbi:MAG: ammonium transporter [Eubacteriaceae bacterium]|jgi:Amt family ammonium transporter|nr:ammonium transporter [Eubacteriaceae bacterium]
MDFGIWYLMGAILVFFMQGGFAAVESGFTRAKNAGNIIMKNLIDFCIGTIVFILLGSGLLMGEDAFMGFIGKPNLGVFTNFVAWLSGNEVDFISGSNFFFNLVFCATTATIVSGAMAERTKFISYCMYSALISLIVYPIEAHWTWGPDGWLAGLGFIDFAGSAVIHMVGGVSSFIGAAMLGPRLGKYATDEKTGKKTSKAIPGHSITLGALGCFILWFCWYGFNGAAAANLPSLSSILVTTTVAPAVATCTTMFFTWIKNGKPDVSMSLNGSLAGLVAITAGCAYVDVLGALVIGFVAGILVVVAVEVIDMKLHVDDPVGAIAVHGANGMWGAIAVGLFANPNVFDPFGDGVATTGAAGLFYGGGFSQLGIQLLGVASIALWTVVTMAGVFFFIKKVFGLRVSPEEEISGLDLPEHGLPSAYADFQLVPDTMFYAQAGLAVPLASAVPIDQAIPVTNTSSPGAKSGSGEQKITKVTIITNQEKYAGLQSALEGIGITGLTVTNVLGFGMQKGHAEAIYRGVHVETRLLPKVQVDIVISKVPVDTLIEAAKKSLYTGRVGDGKIFVYDVESVVKVRTGEVGYDALQDE